MNSNYYDDNAQDFFNKTVSVDMDDIYKQFTALLKPGSRILDMGCGSGRDVLYFKKCGYDIIGIDNSNEMVNLARKYTKKNIILCDFTELDFVDYFDGIWACSSLLHIETKKLVMVFDKILYSARKNGIIYTSFKYGDFEGIRNGRYFNDFTEEKFNMIIQGKNIKIKQIWKTRDKRKDNDTIWLNILLICNL